MAEEIITQIPGFDNGTVWFLEGIDEINALFQIGQMATEILNKYNTNVAVISATCRSAAIQDLIKNESGVAKLYTVNQKNQNLQVILRKIKGMINRKFVRVIFIEGLPEQDAVGKRWLEQLAKSTNTAFVVIEIHDEEAELSLD